MAAEILGLNEISAWVSFLDVYGFRAIIRASSDQQPELFSRLAHVHSQLAQRINRQTKMFVFSDSYFLVNPIGGDPISAYENCLADVRAAIDLHIAADLPLRGGIAHGRVSFGPNVLIGASVVRAVDYERKSRLPLVILPQREVELASVPMQPWSFIDHNVVDEFNSPGILSATFVIPVNTRSYLEYCERKYIEHRVSGPEKVARDWLEVVQVLSRICGETREDDREGRHR